jgi:hypothetical protein
MLALCRHVGTFVSEFKTLVNSHIEDLFERGRPSPAHYGRCYVCDIAWKLRVQCFKQDFYCLELTKWMDLGLGIDRGYCESLFAYSQDLSFNLKSDGLPALASPEGNSVQ